MTLQTQQFTHDEHILDKFRAWTSQTTGVMYPARWWDDATSDDYTDAEVEVDDFTLEEMAEVNGIHPATITAFDQFIQDEMAAQAEELGIPLDEHLMNVYESGTHVPEVRFE